VREIDRALSLIRTIPDYPKKGIVFKDITPLLADGVAFSATVDSLNESLTKETVIAGIEARGFVFASAMASRKNLGFVPIRKAGKLPFTTISKSYGLEYGTDSIEVHSDAFDDGQNVLLVDDVLATGGTICAAIELIKAAGATVTTVAVLLEITSLQGRQRIMNDRPTISIIALTST
jgi:adenine phosphoribosyltransferase